MTNPGAGPSIRFAADEARIMQAAWAAETGGRAIRPLVATRSSPVLVARPRAVRVVVRPRAGGVVVARPQQ